MTLLNAHRLLDGGGILEVDEEKLAQTAYQALHHQFVASASVVKLGKSINPEFKFGCMIAHLTTYPRTCKPEDALATQTMNLINNQFCSDVQIGGEYPFYIQRYFEENNVKINMEPEDLDIIKQGVVDYYTFSYYSSGCLSVDDYSDVVMGNLGETLKNPYLELTDWDWQMDPIGLRYTLNMIYDKYKIPIMIVENGLGTRDTIDCNYKVHDDYRIEYLSSHIYQMLEAVKDGVDLIGYMAWGPIDLVSNSTGEMEKRYGFVYVDKDNYGNGTLKRYKKDSFNWYQKTIKSNGEIL